MVGLGGYHIGGQKDEQESIRIIRTALDSGINFMDNCWDYNGGESEVRMGKALRDGYRQRAFLMTKIDGRTKQAAAQQLEESLRGCRRITSTCCKSMNHSDGRSGSGVCRRGRVGGACCGAGSRQDPLHRIYRTQESRYSLKDATGRGHASVSTSIRSRCL